MHGHELHLVGRLVGVGVGKKRHMGQIVLERGLLAAGDFVIPDGLLELGQIVEPFLTALGAQHLLVAALVQHGRQELRHGALPVFRGKALDQTDELSRLRALEALVVQQLLQRLIQRAAVRGGVFLQQLHPAQADVPLGDVHDAAEGQIVLQGDHAQIAQRVLDLRPAEKLHAAVDRIGDLPLLQRLLHRSRHVMRAVEHGHFAEGYSPVVHLVHLKGQPLRLGLGRVRVVAEDALAARQHGPQIFGDAVVVFADQGVRRREDLRRGAVVFHHKDGLRRRIVSVEIQQIFHVRAAPGVDGLIRVADDEEVFVVIAEHLHQLVLQLVDILKLVDHDVFEPLLPFETDVRILLEDIEREFDQIVVVEAEALLLLIEIAVKNDVLRACRLQVLLMQRVERHPDHVLIVFRALEKLLDLDHVARGGEGHVPQRKSPLLINDAQHRVDIRVVQHKKTLRVLHGVAVLLQDGDAEAVKSVDIAGVVVAGQVMDALAHLVGSLVGKGHAEDVGRQDAQLVDQIGKAVRQRPGLARARARDHAHEALRRRDGLKLRGIQNVFPHDALRSAQHLAEHPKRERGQDDDVLIRGIQRTQTHMPVLRHQLFQVRTAVVKEDADLAGHEAALLMHPDRLPVVIARLHAVSRDAHAEVRALRHLDPALDHLIVFPVEKLAGTGGDRKVVQRQHARRDDLFRLAKGRVPAQKTRILAQPRLPLRVEACAQLVRLAEELPQHVVDLQHPAERKELLRVRERPVALPLADRVLADLDALVRQERRKLRLQQPAFLSFFFQDRTDTHHRLSPLYLRRASVIAYLAIFVYYNRLIVFCQGDLHCCAFHGRAFLPIQ